MSDRPEAGPHRAPVWPAAPPTLDVTASLHTINRSNTSVFLCISRCWKQPFKRKMVASVSVAVKKLGRRRPHGDPGGGKPVWNLTHTWHLWISTLSANVLHWPLRFPTLAPNSSSQTVSEGTERYGTSYFNYTHVNQNFLAFCCQTGPNEAVVRLSDMSANMNS